MEFENVDYRPGKLWNFCPGHGKSWNFMLTIDKCMYGADRPTVDVLCNQLVPLPLNAASVAAPIIKL